jgi:hypothetical protein
MGHGTSLNEPELFSIAIIGTDFSGMMVAVHLGANPTLMLPERKAGRVLRQRKMLIAFTDFHAK